MLYRRAGYPEVDEIVLCKVTTINPNSVFVDLLEFGKQGLVHISEIAPGRIRNLREYVSEGRQIICKILRIDRERGHIDLSLRRVNSHERQAKMDEIKQESKSETLVQNLAKKLKRPADALYAEVTKVIFNNYSHLYLCFKDVVAGAVNLEKMGLDKVIAQDLTTAILDKFKPPKVTLDAEVTLITYSDEGVEKIRKLLKEIEAVSPTLRVMYLGGGKYKTTVEDADYKSAEKKLKLVQEILEKFNDKVSTATFLREKHE